jgi:hypothetical protein
MNHTKSTLVIVAIAVGMVAAAALTISSNLGQLAFAKGTAIKAGGGLKVSGTSNSCKEDADNSQHVAFGAGSVGDAAVNIPINAQVQDCNAGSTGSGGGNSHSEDRSSDGNSGVWNSGLSTSDH